MADAPSHAKADGEVKGDHSPATRAIVEAGASNEILPHLFQQSALYADMYQLKRSVYDMLGVQKADRIPDAEEMAVVAFNWPYLDFTSVTLVALNGLWLALDACQKEKDSFFEVDLWHQSFAYVFTLFVVFEWFIHFKTRGYSWSKCVDSNDFWFVFNTGLMLVQVLERNAMTLALFSDWHDARRGYHGVSAVSLVRVTQVVRTLRSCRFLSFAMDSQRKGLKKKVQKQAAKRRFQNATARNPGAEGPKPAPAYEKKDQ